MLKEYHKQGLGKLQQKRHNIDIIVDKKLIFEEKNRICNKDSSNISKQADDKRCLPDEFTLR